MKHMRSIAPMLALGLVCFGQLALAESNCKEAKGNLVEVNPGGNTASGTLSNGGWLNGTTLVVFLPGGSSTPLPTVFTFLGQFTLNSDHGQLKVKNLYTYDVVKG